MKVLVAYGTVHGSTRSIAENIGRALAVRHQVTTIPLSAARDLRAYGAFVLGSAEADGSWLPTSCEFLEQHASDLAGKPVWLFGVSASGAFPRPVRGLARESELRHLAACTPAAIRPQGLRVFTGLIRRDELPSRTDRFLLAIRRLHDADLRPWPEIMTWAHGIATTLAEPQAA